MEDGGEVDDGGGEVDDGGRVDVEKVDERDWVADEAVGDVDTGDGVVDRPVAVASEDSDSDIGVAVAGSLLLGMLMA